MPDTARSKAPSTPPGAEGQSSKGLKPSWKDIEELDLKEEEIIKSILGNDRHDLLKKHGLFTDEAPSRTIDFIDVGEVSEFDADRFQNFLRAQARHNDRALAIDEYSRSFVPDPDSGICPHCANPVRTALGCLALTSWGGLGSNTYQGKTFGSTGKKTWSSGLDQADHEED